MDFLGIHGPHVKNRFISIHLSLFYISKPYTIGFVPLFSFNLYFVFYDHAVSRFLLSTAISFSPFSLVLHRNAIHIFFIFSITYFLFKYFLQFIKSYIHTHLSCPNLRSAFVPRLRYHSFLYSPFLSHFALLFSVYFRSFSLFCIWYFHYSCCGLFIFFLLLYIYLTWDIVHLKFHYFILIFLSSFSLFSL